MAILRIVVVKMILKGICNIMSKKQTVEISTIVVLAIIFIGSLCALIFILKLAHQQDIADAQNLRTKMEYAYFEGQKDALSGRIRVRKSTADPTKWVRTDSAWDTDINDILKTKKEER